MNGLALLDGWLIAPFRWPQSARLGFLLGIALLALQCVLAGQLCLALLNRAQARLRLKYDQEAAKHQDLSFQALKLQDKAAYLVQNQMAQQAYGHSMALTVGRGAAYIWPLPMGLAWLGLRFRDAGLPLPFIEAQLPAGVVFGALYLCWFVLLRRASAWLAARKARAPQQSLPEDERRDGNP